MTRNQVPGQGIVRWAARLVPWHRRGEWEAEWRAELDSAWQRWSGAGADTAARGRLRRRAWGAVRDALEVRRQYGGSGMSGSEVRQAVRALARRPRFAAAVVLTLALGVGGAAAMYTVLDGLVLRPAPFPDVERVVELHTAFAPGTTAPVLMAEGVTAWQEQGSVFTDVQAYGYRGSILAGAGEPRHVTVAMVTGGLLPLLGARPLLGRLPDPAGAGDEVVIAESVWRQELGGAADVLGRRLELDEGRYTVVGVLPSSFRYPAGEPKVWQLSRLGGEGMAQVHAVGRVQPGLSRTGVEAEVARIGERLTAAGAGGGFPATLELRWLADSQLRPELQRALWLLAAAVLLVLLIACFNATNLLLVEASGRGRELAIRGALGATRGRLAGQLVLESVLLGATSAAAGLLLAGVLVRTVLALAPAELMETALRPVQVNTGTTIFALGVAVAAAVLYSLVPALRAAAGADLLHTSRATHGRRMRRARGIIVAAEVALSVILVTAAGLLLNSFVRLSREDPGFQPRGLVEFRVFPRAGGEQFLQELEERLAALPQVARVARGDAAPAHASVTYRTYALQPFGVPDDAVLPGPGVLPVLQVDSAFLGVLRAPLREGRNLLPEDVATGGVLIDADLAAHLWPNQSAVGQRFRVSGRGDAPYWHVVGVTADIGFLGPDRPDAPFLILRHAPQERRGNYFVVRAAGDPAAAAVAAQTLIRSLDPGLPVPEMRHVPESLRGTFADRRFIMLLIAGFAVVSTGLAMVGLYGVISHAVAQRTREIGIRMALGARRSRVIMEVAGGGALLIGMGLLLGLAGAFAATRLLETMLFGVQPRDAPTFAAVAFAVATIALAAAIVPASRAARVDPARALRHD